MDRPTDSDSPSTSTEKLTSFFFPGRTVQEYYPATPPPPVHLRSAAGPSPRARLAIATIIVVVVVPMRSDNCMQAARLTWSQPPPLLGLRERGSRGGKLQQGRNVEREREREDTRPWGAPFNRISSIWWQVRQATNQPTNQPVGCSQPHVPSLARVRYGKYKRTPVDLGGGQRLDIQGETGTVRDFSESLNEPYPSAVTNLQGVFIGNQ
ncbi:uncharacterized protein RCO7_10475 [Rhynchosporium graminicola]|uniref:Uncharacterized protein n=1 Tax=Rhynchosporium graminicola TaxID=2792576 RepID=A0A1E1LP24_9HELO|nr:uncharacterized protein RCO7_10475 [Rhynchosporium commune]